MDRINLNRLALSALFTVGCLLASCQLDPVDIPSEELYTRAFIKKFGLIDKDHDWNMVTRGEVTVDVDQKAAVKVLATIGGKNYILANYINVLGTRTLTFDMPKGVTDIIVCSGSVSVKTKVGQTVDLSGAMSRAFIEQETSDPYVSTRSLAAEKDRWMVIPWLNGTIFRRKMPEGYYNADREGVSPDFMFRNDASTPITFTIRPLFWQTNRTHKLGIFYYNEAGETVHIPIWQMEKNGNYTEDLLYAVANAKVKYVEVGISDPMIQKYLKNYNVDIEKLSAFDNFSKDCSGVDDHNMTFACREYLQEILPELPGRTDGKKFNYVYRWKFREENSKLLIVYTYFDYTIIGGAGGGDSPWGQWPDPDGGLPDKDIPGEYDKYNAIVSKGIEVTIQPGVVYGFYLEDDTDSSKRYYSTRELNAPATGWYPVGERGEDDHYTKFEKRGYASYAATWMATKYTNWRYLAFEDWDTNEYNFESNMKDLNDLVFIIEDGAPAPTLVDIEHGDKVKPAPTPYSWILAAEDLGNMDDFDFNDFVVRITPGEVDDENGTKKLAITALAAGGTLPLQLKRIDENTNEEVIVGGEFHTWFGDGTTSFSTMINTGSGPNLDGKVEEIIVPKDFTLAKHQLVDENNHNMGGFTIEVERQDGKRDDIVAPSRQNEAPQMICVLGGWGWPKERIEITKAYPLFDAWIENKDKDWFVKDQFVPGHLYKQPTFDTETDSIGGGGGETPDRPIKDENIVFEGPVLQNIGWDTNKYKVTIPKKLLKENTQIKFAKTGSSQIPIFSKQISSWDDDLLLTEFTYPYVWTITSENLTKLETNSSYGETYIVYLYIGGLEDRIENITIIN